MGKKLISIVTPVFNEEDNIDFCYSKLKEVTDSLADKFDFEFIFTDNASTDKSFQLLSDIAAKDSRVSVYSFSRNFGYQKSILTGYHKAKGDCAIEFDCDLQDPPEMLPEFIKLWEEGNEIVYGIRKSRQEGKLVTMMRKAFYRVINSISENKLPADAGDFMMLDRKILDQIKHINDQNPYLRGSIFEMGFNRKGIPYERNARVNGTTKFPFKKMFGLAMDGIISQSTVPLRIASYIGIFVTLATLLLSAFYIISKMYFDIDLPTGLTTTIVFVLFSISLNALFLGLIGEYVLRIYNQVRNKPLTIINKQIVSSDKEN